MSRDFSFFDHYRFASQYTSSPNTQSDITHDKTLGKDKAAPDNHHITAPDHAPEQGSLNGRKVTKKRTQPPKVKSTEGMLPKIAEQLRGFANWVVTTLTSIPSRFKRQEHNNDAEVDQQRDRFILLAAAILKDHISTVLADDFNLQDFSCAGLLKIFIQIDQKLPVIKTNADNAYAMEIYDEIITKTMKNLKQSNPQAQQKLDEALSTDDTKELYLLLDMAAQRALMDAESSNKATEKKFFLEKSHILSNLLNHLQQLSPVVLQAIKTHPELSELENTERLDVYSISIQRYIAVIKEIGIPLFISFGTPFIDDRLIPKLLPPTQRPHRSFALIRPPSLAQH